MTTKNAKTIVQSLADMEKEVLDKGTCRLQTIGERFLAQGYLAETNEFFGKNGSMVATGRACGVGHIVAVLMPILHLLSRSGSIQASVADEEESFQKWVTGSSGLPPL